jgi:hypothetical protein
MPCEAAEPEPSRPVHGQVERVAVKVSPRVVQRPLARAAFVPRRMYLRVRVLLVHGGVPRGVHTPPLAMVEQTTQIRDLWPRPTRGRPCRVIDRVNHGSASCRVQEIDQGPAAVFAAPDRAASIYRSQRR